MAIRLINATRTEIQKMTAADLKKAIWDSEGRVILSQNCVMFPALCMGVTNAELAQAMGADMVFFNLYSADPKAEIPALKMVERTPDGYKSVQYRIPEMRRLVDVPIGVYFECGQGLDISNAFSANNVRNGFLANAQNFRQVKEEGANFVVLGGNPGTGVKYDAVISAVKMAKKEVGDDMLIFAGKWEDGAEEPVIGDPTKPQSYYKEIIAELIDAGADCITMSMPGSRWGITVDCIRELVTFVHTYKPGTLALTFLDGTIEGADVDTVRQCSLWSKQTGADIHAFGDAGLGGMTIPEDIYAASIALKGRMKTWERMAASRR